MYVQINVVQFLFFHFINIVKEKKTDAEVVKYASFVHIPSISLSYRFCYNYWQLILRKCCKEVSGVALDLPEKDRGLSQVKEIDNEEIKWKRSLCGKYFGSYFKTEHDLSRLGFYICLTYKFITRYRLIFRKVYFFFIYSSHSFWFCTQQPMVFNKTFNFKRNHNKQLKEKRN